MMLTNQSIANEKKVQSYYYYDIHDMNMSKPQYCLCQLTTLPDVLRYPIPGLPTIHKSSAHPRDLLVHHA